MKILEAFCKGFQAPSWHWDSITDTMSGTTSLFHHLSTVAKVLQEYVVLVPNAWDTHKSRHSGDTFRLSIAP